MNTFEKGRAGENMAAAYLKKKGFDILKTNFRTPEGEIDIIAGKNDEISFVEVKSWRSSWFEDIGLSIDRDKRKRIIDTSRYYLSRHNCSNLYIHYDVVFVDRYTGGIEYIENAFTETGI